MSLPTSNPIANAASGARAFLRSLFAGKRAVVDGSPRCALCLARQTDPRLAIVLGMISRGQFASMATIREKLGSGFKDVSRLVHTLKHELHLPLRRTRRGVYLTAPIHVCPDCVRRNERHPASDNFRTVPDAAGTGRARAQGGQAVRFFTLPPRASEGQTVQGFCPVHVAAGLTAPPSS
jgi:hypothetical protein